MSDCEAWEECCVGSCPNPPTWNLSWRTKNRTGYTSVHNAWVCDEHRDETFLELPDETVTTLPWQPDGPTFVPWGRIAQEGDG